MKRIGKIGKRNIEANKVLKQEYGSRGITRCELRLEGCMGFMMLAFCHRHPREWYRAHSELLGDFRQTVLGCQNCHEILDNRAKTTKEEAESIFLRLRGYERETNTNRI